MLFPTLFPRSFQFRIFYVSVELGFLLCHAFLGRFLDRHVGELLGLKGDRTGLRANTVICNGRIILPEGNSSHILRSSGSISGHKSWSPEKSVGTPPRPPPKLKCLERHSRLARLAQAPAQAQTPAHAQDLCQVVSRQLPVFRLPAGWVTGVIECVDLSPLDGLPSQERSHMRERNRCWIYLVVGTASLTRPRLPRQPSRDDEEA